MLGEKIGESTGKITGQRVVSCEATGSIKVETSMQTTGKLLNTEVSEIGSYTSIMREGGILEGSGQGVLMTRDGESCTWHGTGVGKPTGKGAGVMYRGAVFYQTRSAKLARLNGTCAVFEYEVDENGATRAQLWEWK